MPSNTHTVMITGASGYIAGWIVKLLLEAGHTVHATVRDPNKAASVAHLNAIAEKAPGTLKLFKADLLDADSFDAAMQGCDILMHTASPFVLDGFTDANEALVRPAVEGTRNVLNAALRCDTLKRVVLTSSVASVYGDATDMKGKRRSPKPTGIPPAALITIRTSTPRWPPSGKPGESMITRRPMPKTAGIWSRSTRGWCMARH